MMLFGAMMLLCIVAILGTIGNLFIIGAVCLSKRLRVRSHAFIVNLAIADLIMTSYIMPMGLTTSQYDMVPFGQLVCEINAFLILTTCGVSTQSLMLIAIERYFHICKTKHYQKIFTPKLVALYICLIWVYTIILTCQGWTGWTRYRYGVEIYVCLFDGPTSVSFNVCLVVFGMLLPMAVIIYVYSCILRTVNRSRSSLLAHRKRTSVSDSSILHSLSESQRNVRKEYKLILTLISIVIVFVICWTPAAIVLVMAGLWLDMPDPFYTISVWFAFSNSSLNSIIYGILNKNFRKGYGTLLRYICCRRVQTRCCGKCAALNSQDESVSNSQGKQPYNTDAPPNHSPGHAYTTQADHPSSHTPQHYAANPNRHTGTPSASSALHSNSTGTQETQSQPDMVTAQLHKVEVYHANGGVVDLPNTVRDDRRKQTFQKQISTGQLTLTDLDIDASPTSPTITYADYSGDPYIETKF